MMNDINPYSCTIPGRLFVGYEELRKELLTGFRDGNSYAILGGRRCGKTSLLLQIEKDLHTKADWLTPFHPLPRFLDIQTLSHLTPNMLFEMMYNLIVKESEIQPWDAETPGREYQTFLKLMDEVKLVLDAQYGTHWLVILLIDELDAALEKLPDDQFFQNLRNLLMLSPLHRHFRIIATGVREMSKLILSGSSPLNNLLHEYLRIFNDREIETLIQAGFPDGLNTNVKSLLIELTGGHPYLLQGILEKLWQDRQHVNETSVKRATKKFLIQHRDFEHWMEYFDVPEHTVYRRLLEAHGGTCHINELRTNMDPLIVPRIYEALTVLSYHGVIEEVQPDEYRIVGTLFQYWYQDNYLTEEKRSSLEPYIERLDNLVKKIELTED